MKKVKIIAVVLYGLSLYFMGMCTFADQSAALGIAVTVAGCGCFISASALNIAHILAERKNRGGTT